MKHKDTKLQSFLRNYPDKNERVAYAPIPDEVERIAALIVDAAFAVHKALGAGFAGKCLRNVFLL